MVEHVRAHCPISSRERRWRRRKHAATECWTGLRGAAGERRNDSTCKEWQYDDASTHHRTAYASQRRARAVCLLVGSWRHQLRVCARRAKDVGTSLTPEMEGGARRKCMRGPRAHRTARCSTRTRVGTTYMQHQHMTQHGPGVPAYHNIACHTTQQSLASLYGTTMHSFKKTRSSGLSQFRDIAVQAAQFWQRSSGELHTRFSSDSEHARSSGKSQSHTHHPLPPSRTSRLGVASRDSRQPPPHTPHPK